jgi:8-oxo-dGTP pyrophosphatase MutT (NUDIX family)
MRYKVQVWIYRPLAGGKDHEILFLLLRPERGGFWQPVTGGVETGEVIAAAALREATEETGLPFATKPRSLDYSFAFERDGKRFEEHVFALEAPAGVPVRIDPHEHVDHRWIPAESAAKEKLKHDSNAEGLRRLLAGLKLEAR